MIEVTILPEDFAGSSYTDPFDCPLFRALKRQGVDVRSVGGFGYVTMNDDSMYAPDNDSLWDMIKASEVKESEQPYTLTLTPYNGE